MKKLMSAALLLLMVLSMPVSGLAAEQGISGCFDADDAHSG